MHPFLVFVIHCILFNTIAGLLASMLGITSSVSPFINGLVGFIYAKQMELKYVKATRK